MLRHHHLSLLTRMGKAWGLLLVWSTSSHLSVVHAGGARARAQPAAKPSRPPGGLLYQRSCCSHTPAVHTLLVKSHLSLLHAGEHSASAACSSPSAACCSNAPSSDRKPSIARPSAAASSCATCPKKHRKHTQDMLYIYLYSLGHNATAKLHLRVMLLQAKQQSSSIATCMAVNQGATCTARSSGKFCSSSFSSHL